MRNEELFAIFEFADLNKKKRESELDIHLLAFSIFLSASSQLPSHSSRKHPCSCIQI